MTKIIPTTEQNLLVETAIAGKNICAKAFAGASKTTSCVLIAEAVNKPSLYVAFNKSIAEEATTKFPNYVECKTMHSLAWRAIVRYSKSAFGKKLSANLSINDLPVLCPDEEDINIDMQIEVMNIIKLFCQSAEYSLPNFISKYEELLEKPLHEDIVTAIINYWNDLTNENHPAQISHDVYLKLYQLSKPILSYSVIYLDEAQDSNPVTLDIVLRQKHCQIILVGDPYQAIYEWRGAINAMDNLPENFVELYLTESFRYTQDIANKASTLLSLAGNEKQICGKAIPKEKGNSLPWTKAVIVRNNATMLSYLLQAVETNTKVLCLGNLNELWNKLYHIQSLYYKEQPRYPDKELRQYKTYTALIKAADKLPELKKLINITAQLSSGGLTANINNIKSILVKDKESASFTLTTAHKSKGLEWDEVTLVNDLCLVDETESEVNNTKLIYDALMENQTLNLLYVALTRAKYTLNLADNLKDIFYKIENDCFAEYI